MAKFSRRSFLGGLLALPVVAALSKAQPSSAVQEKSVSPSGYVGGHFRDHQGNEYVFCRLDPGVAEGTIVLIGSGYRASSYNRAGRGMMGIAASTTQKGFYGWIQVYGVASLRAEIPSNVYGLCRSGAKQMDRRIFLNYPYAA